MALNANQKMKGRWTERTEGRTASANSKGKSLTKRARGGVRKEKEKQSKKNWRVLWGRAPSLKHSAFLSTPHTHSSASQVIKWISCLVLSERTWPSTLRERVERHSRAALCAICILVSEQGPKQTRAVLGLGGQGHTMEPNRERATELWPSRTLTDLHLQEGGKEFWSLVVRWGSSWVVLNRW